MADRRRHWDGEDELPVYLARPGTTEPVPRQKFGGMFCSVEGAYESKSIDFEALSVGQRSSRGASKARSPQGEQPGSESRPGGPPGDQGIDIGATAGKEILQNLDDLKRRKKGRGMADAVAPPCGAVGTLR
ncbi:dihydropyrimidinase-related protein 3 isoform X1 [Arapaima gigas]